MQNECIETAKKIQIEKIENWCKSPKNFLVLLGNMKEEDYNEIVNIICDHEVIIVDNFSSLYQASLRKQILFQSVDSAYSSLTPTIIISDLNEKEFYETYGQRIASRIFAKENTIIDLFGCDDLRKKGL